MRSIPCLASTLAAVCLVLPCVAAPLDTPAALQHAPAPPLAAAPLHAPAPRVAAAPPTPREPVVDTYHGVEVVDPYRWMEDMAAPAWTAWLKAQAAHAEGVLARIPGRAVLHERLRALADAGESVSRLQRRGRRVFYLKSEPGRETPRLYVREGARERLLLDPDTVPRTGGRLAIDFHAPSPDGRLVALGLSAGGSEDSVLHVLVTSSGRLLPGGITRAGLNDTVGWRPDGRSFFYNRLPPPHADRPAERYSRSTVHVHVVGRDAARDPVVFGGQAVPGLELDAADLPTIVTQAGSPWAMAVVRHGDAPQRSVYVAPLARAGAPNAPWRRVVGPQDEVRDAVLAGQRLYALSVRGAPRGQLLAHDLQRPARAARSRVPQGTGVLRRAVATADALVVETLEGGVSRLLRVPLAGGPAAALPLPFEGSVRELHADPGAADVVAVIEGWTRAPQVVRIGADGRAADTGWQRPPALDTPDVEARRVEVESADGTRVPLTILSRRGLSRDGSHPALLTGYGAYGIPMEPRFSARRLAWLERGGVYAVAHVRGGGENGADWHNGARVVNGNKQNTVNDFIACAEHLVAAGYTSAGRIAGAGGSAGGLALGAAITQRPQLFAAAHSAAGLADLLRAETTPNGPPNIPEFGTVADPAHWRTMWSLSPYHRIRDGVAYPAVIATTGANDPRVEPWHPGKLAARLQAATASGRPVLLRVDFDAGHGVGSTRSQAVAEQADVWSFLLWQMGEPGFQPPP